MAFGGGCNQFRGDADEQGTVRPSVVPAELGAVTAQIEDLRDDGCRSANDDAAAAERRRQELLRRWDIC